MKPLFTAPLPWPPSVNSLYMQGKTHGQKFLTKKAKEYKKACFYLFQDEYEPIDQPLTAHLYLFPPTSHDRDVDNFTKAPLDALTQLGIIRDDSLIQDIHKYKCGKHPTITKGCFYIVLVPYEKPDLSSITQHVTDKLYAMDLDDEELLEYFVKPTTKKRR